MNEKEIDLIMSGLDDEFLMRIDGLDLSPEFSECEEIQDLMLLEIED